MSRQKSVRHWVRRNRIIVEVSEKDKFTKSGLILQLSLVAVTFALVVAAFLNNKAAENLHKIAENNYQISVFNLNETRNLRKIIEKSSYLEARPWVYLKPLETSRWLNTKTKKLEFHPIVVVTNVGKVPAYNLKFDMIITQGDNSKLKSVGPINKLFPNDIRGIPTPKLIIDLDQKTYNIILKFIESKQEIKLLKPFPSSIFLNIEYLYTDHEGKPQKESYQLKYLELVNKWVEVLS